MKELRDLKDLTIKTGVQDGARGESDRADQDDARNYLRLLDFYLPLLGKPRPEGQKNKSGKSQLLSERKCQLLVRFTPLHQPHTADFLNNPESDNL